MTKPAPKRWFRFSLRTMMLAVLVICVSIPLGQYAWRQYVLSRDAREYAALRAKKEEEWRSQRNLGSGSLAIDQGRLLPDDFVVLVRKGDVFGCVIPKKQFAKGESLEYEWYYRTDGGGRFIAGHPSVESGETFAGPYVSGSGELVTVSFGPFEIDWSGGGPGWGYLYHESEPGPDPVMICLTDYKRADLIDARDPQWIYKASNGDVGVPGDVDLSDATAEQPPAEKGD